MVATVGNFHADWVTAPGQDAFAVTPSDSANTATPFRALYIGSGGNVALVTLGGATVTFVGLVTGQILPVCGTRVNSTNTTASSIVGIV